jgi:hypothetical protein
MCQNIIIQGGYMEDVEGYGYLIDLIIKGGLGFYKLMIVFAIILLILVIICLIAHIYGSIGISKMAKSKGEKYSFFAWIPQLNNLVISKIAFNSYYVGTLMLCCTFIQLIFYDNASSFFDFTIWIIYCIMFINYSSPFIILYYVLSIACALKIYKQYTRNYIILTIASILTLNLATPFIYYTIRNKNKIK